MQKAYHWRIFTPANNQTIWPLQWWIIAPAFSQPRAQNAAHRVTAEYWFSKVSHAQEYHSLYGPPVRDLGRLRINQSKQPELRPSSKILKNRKPARCDCGFRPAPWLILSLTSRYYAFINRVSRHRRHPNGCPCPYGCKQADVIQRPAPDIRW